MVLTTEQRIELLHKARQAKAEKKRERDALKPIPVKGRPKKEVNKTLDLVETREVPDEELEEIIKPSKQEVEEIEKIKNIGNSTKRTTKKIETEVGSIFSKQELEEVYDGIMHIPYASLIISIHKNEKPEKRLRLGWSQIIERNKKYVFDK
jgi:hypothetical protein